MAQTWLYSQKFGYIHKKNGEKNDARSKKMRITLDLGELSLHFLHLPWALQAHIFLLKF